MVSDKRIAVIGGGLLGTTLAYFFSKRGQKVTLIEQGAQLGGLHRMVRLDEALTMPRYQHYLMPNDHHILSLIDDLGLKHQLIRHPANSGLLNNGSIHPTRSVWDFMRLSTLGIGDRLRLANTVLQARLTRDWRQLDNVPVKDWLIRSGGQTNFDRIWAPLLEAKFDYDYDRVPATFIWSWLNLLSKSRPAPSLAGEVLYLRDGIRKLINLMADHIVASGGEIRTETRVREIEVIGDQLGRVRTHTGILEFDAVVVALPTPDFSRLLLSADEDYLDRLSSTRYLGLICPSLIVDRPLSGYWTLNITDPSSPFSSLVELPHPQHPNLHMIYMPKYTASDNDWMGVGDDVIRNAWISRLRQIFPALKEDNIKHFVVHRSRYVEPIHYLNAAQEILPIKTPYNGLFLTTASQVYPNLPTSDAIIGHALRTAQHILAEMKERDLAMSIA